MNRKLQALFGMKWNPFLPGVPAGALHRDARLGSFLARMEHLCEIGGYALVTGAVGTGKSSALRILEEHLGRIPDLCTVVLTRPQCSVNDFYRELGDLFEINLNPCNRWGGTRRLRHRWLEHLEQSGKRAVVIVDEAQALQGAVIDELRLLASHELDSCSLLAVVLAGDERLAERFRTPELLPLGSRIRLRLGLGQKSPEELAAILEHGLKEAGAKSLMTPAVLEALAGHAAGNLRVVMNMAADLLEAAVEKEVERIDEQLFFETFESLVPVRPPRSKARARATAR